MSVNKNKKSISAQTLEEMKQLTSAIREESKNTINTLLKEAVKDYIREADEEEEVETDYEVVDEPTEDTDTENSESTETETETDEVETEIPADDVEDTEEAPEEEETGEGENDEWANYSKYQVDNDTYDLTGEEDYDEVVKVYKLLKNDDEVAVKKDGDKISIKDAETGAEYVIDLNSDEECSDEEDCEAEIEMEGLVRETAEDIAGFNNDFDFKNEFDSDDEIELNDDIQMENKKSRKTMKENKEIVLEIDLGYTDNYQDKNPIDGLSMTEPSKSGESWEKGVPTGTEKPWAGDSKSKGEPFESTVNEEENPNVEADQEGMFEGTNVTMPNRRKKSKSHSPMQKDNPKVAHHDSKNGDYKAIEESIVKKVKAIQNENKELRNAVEELKTALREAAITNINLGQFAKLIIETTTTKDEKVKILNRFHNEAKTFEQSKSLYESIKKELDANTKTLNVEANNTKTAQGSTINESVVYKSKDLLNTIDLMKRMEGC